MTPQERDPSYLIDQGLLEPLQDFTHGKQLIPASRLGYRINDRFVRRFFGRVFDTSDLLANAVGGVIGTVGTALACASRGRP